MGQIAIYLLNKSEFDIREGETQFDINSQREETLTSYDTWTLLSEASACVAFGSLVMGVFFKFFNPHPIIHQISLMTTDWS